MSVSRNNYSYHPPGAAPAVAAGKIRNGSEDDDDEDRCCGVACIKFSLHLFNFIFFLSGILLMGVGFWTLISKHPSLILLTSGLYDFTAYALIIAGIMILGVSILGCCGINKDDPCMILTYSIVLGAVILLEVGVGVVAYVYRENIRSELSDNLLVKFNEEYGENNVTTPAIDQLQIEMKCCGVRSFEDWRDTAWWNSPLRVRNKVPDSCCITPSRYCGVRDHPSNIRYTGCIDRVGKIAGDHLIIVGAVALGVCLIQIFGITLACILHYKIKDLTYYG